MKTNYQVKDLRVHKEGKIATFKRRLKAVIMVLFNKGFIAVTAELKGENYQIDIINHNVDSKTTINALSSYTNVLIDNEYYSDKMDKNIEKWLHTEN